MRKLSRGAPHNCDVLCDSTFEVRSLTLTGTSEAGVAAVQSLPTLAPHDIQQHERPIALTGLGGEHQRVVPVDAPTPPP